MADTASDTSSSAEDFRETLREVVETTEMGAPRAGSAVGDLFSTDEIFRRIIVTAQEEFARSNRLLFLSGLAAGLTMSLSFVGKAALAGLLTSDPGGLISNLFYPLSFVLVALGRYQLFTENTLTPVTLVLTRLASIPRLLRIWGVVLAANLIGALLAAIFFAYTDVLEPEVHEAALEIGLHMMSFGGWTLFSKGIIAGWLVASMVWLIHAVREATARLLLIFVLIYLIPTAELAHCIVGAAEVAYAALEGSVGWGAYVVDFLIPVILGNTVGGVCLVALLNYGQTREECFPDLPMLSWRGWLLGSQEDPGHDGLEEGTKDH